MWLTWWVPPGRTVVCDGLTVRAWVYFVLFLVLWRASLIALLVKNLPAMLEILIQFLGWEDPLEKDRLPIQYSWASLVVQLVKNPPATWETWVGTIPWRREKLPTPVFWPGEFHGLYSPWGYKESDTTEQLSLHFSLVKTWDTVLILGDL